MLSTATLMASKLAEALTNPKISQAEVAEKCGVTKQAVQGWLKTGRFDKKHLAKLSKLTNRPLSWWLDGDSGESNEAAPSSDQNLRYQTIFDPQSVINDLRLMALQSALVSEDWLLLHSIAKRLAVNSQRSIDPQDLPLEVNADAQDIIDKRVREAQQRREQTQQQGQLPTKKRTA